MVNFFTDLPEIPWTRRDDLHNLKYLKNADLVLFMAGNQFMVMDDLLREFRRSNPGVRRIFYETLPPGLELKQILAGAARFGEMVIEAIPDVYTSVHESAMRELMQRDMIDEYFIYLHNRIVLMVPEGNPAGITSVRDLGRDEVRVSQPGAMEDISHYILSMYEKAGGDGLVKRILEEKRAEGTSILTVVHHRETLLRIEKGTADVGPVWATEVVDAVRKGHRVEAVEPGEKLDQRGDVNYFVTKLRKAPNPGNAELFLNFIKSSPAQEIYRSYGFVPPFAGGMTDEGKTGSRHGERKNA